MIVDANTNGNRIINQIFSRRQPLTQQAVGYVLAPAFWRRRFGAAVLAPGRFGAGTFWRHIDNWTFWRHPANGTFWRQPINGTFWRHPDLDVLAPSCRWDVLAPTYQWDVLAPAWDVLAPPFWRQDFLDRLQKFFFSKCLKLKDITPMG